MTRTIAASLRRRAGRALALLLGVLVATTGFVVLTGTAETARLQAIGTVGEHFRGSYDILVRPAGARADVEDQRGLVRPNFLAGTYGGITIAQWEQITRLSGVEAAAPIAMLGYAESVATLEVDITDAVDPTADRQLIEVRPTWLTDRGLTESAEEAAALVYVTTQPVAWPVGWTGGGEVGTYSDGVRRQQYPECYPNSVHLVPYEVLPRGEALPICPYRPHSSEVADRARVASVAAHRTHDGEFHTFEPIRGEVRSDRLTVQVTAPMPLLVAAIDPDAEAALVGLDGAIVSGRYLEGDEGTLPPDETSPELPIAPALVVREPVFDEQVSLAVRRLGAGDDATIAGLTGDEIDVLISRLPGAPDTWASTPVWIGDGYAPLHWGDPDKMPPDIVGLDMETLRQVGPIAYEHTPAGVLRPQVHRPAAQAWHLPGVPYGSWMPWLAHDTGFREIRPVAHEQVLGSLFSHPRVVGSYDPALLTAVDGLGRVPLETYVMPSVEGGDGASRQLLGNQSLLPSTNPGGYLTTSPSVLIALSTLLEGMAGGAGPGDVPEPISAVRVRVAGVTGFDDLSQERVRLVAEQIAEATGLDVDIMLGSSLSPQPVQLPAGQFGRDELLLSESWSLKGAAVAITDAVDRKSVVLFGLILVVCVLFVANAAAAAVRDRRRELALLACLGWSRWRLGATIGGEVGVVGLAAGLLAASVAPGLGQLAGVTVSMDRAALAVPVALGLALLAAVVPAWRASRAHPGAAVWPAVARPRARAGHHRGVPGMAIGNLLRVPGRTLLAVLALAVGTGGLTMLLAVLWVFDGAVTGTLLGDAVSVRVRAVDAMAVGVTLLLSLVALADVLYVNVRERATELATLRATGWSGVAVGRLLTLEGLGIGLLGAALGAGIGLAGAAWFADAMPVALLGVTAVVAGGGVVLAGVAALVPVMLTRRTPMAALLAQE